jgi:SAM-dependent methyltransferase
MPACGNAEYMLAELLAGEIASTCGQASRQNYLAMHQARFAELLELCRHQVPDQSARILDVGRSELTSYLGTYYRNIHTLGLDPGIDDGGHREVSSMDGVPHIVFDLLSSSVVSSWPDCGGFDLIVFSEVIEHLTVAPEFVFAALGSMLTDRGILICSTPNAADFAKRLRLIFGRNPYERLRLYPANPGHIREYTRLELCDIATSVGLACRSHSYHTWIQSHGRSRIKTAVKKLIGLYPSFRPFQVCVLSKSGISATGLSDARVD